MITIKTPEEIKVLREGGKILASILYEVAGYVKSGIATIELDDLAERLIKKAGGRPSFLGHKGRGDGFVYPASLCVSVNNEIVHGIPSHVRILKEGDIVSLDLGLEYKKLYTDMALTVGVGKISPEAEKLINVTKESLTKGIPELKEGATIGNYSFAVQSFVEKSGFSVVKDLVGHGVGYSVHEPPDIPNYGEKGKGFKLEAGMVFALEPMVCQGKHQVFLDKDKWTWKTKDGLFSAHFEHTIAVEKKGPKVLTIL